MKFIPRFTKSLLPLIAVGFLPLVSNGAQQLSAKVEGLPGGYTTPTQIALSGTVSDAESGSSGAGSIVGRSSATHGLLRVYSQAQAPATGSLFNVVYVGSTAMFKDDVTINAPGLLGTSGSITVKFTIDGTLTAVDIAGRTNSNNPNAAEASYSLQKDTYTVSSGYSLVNSDGSSYNEKDGAYAGSSFLGLEQTATINFIYGTPFELRLEVYARAEARTEFGGSAVADLEHTAEWGGITSVKDSLGNDVTNFTVSASSGTNWAQAVPEPVGASLFLLGGALLATRRKRA